MRKLLILLMVIFLAGCMRVRTYTVEKPRTDADIEGNQGYLSGSPKETQKESELSSTRKISVLEFEFGPKSEEVTSDLTEKPEPAYEKEVYREREPTAPKIKAKEYSPASREYEYKSYIIQENDTLQKISSKFYGTTRKWEFIYQENEDTLSSPDKIYPGTKIKIPVLK